MLTSDQVKELTVSSIAHSHLGLSTLETRHRDSLDFKQFACWQIKRALNAAYEAGQKSNKPNKKERNLKVKKELG